MKEVDPDTIAWMWRNSIRLVGADPQKPGHVIWRRMDRVDELDYEFSTSNRLKAQAPEFHADLLDAVHDAGVRQGGDVWRYELKRLIERA